MGQRFSVALMAQLARPSGPGLSGGPHRSPGRLSPHGTLGAWPSGLHTAGLCWLCISIDCLEKISLRSTVWIKVCVISGSAPPQKMACPRKLLLSVVWCVVTGTLHYSARYCLLSSLVWIPIYGRIRISPCTSRAVLMLSPT